MKFEQTDYSNKEEILKFPDHYVAIAVTVDDDGVEYENGRKIVPAGTVVGGVDAPVLENEDEKVEEKNESSTLAGTELESSGDNSDLIVTAKEAGSTGNDISVEIINNEDSTSDIKVEVEGEGEIKIIAEDDGSSIISTAEEIKQAINEDFLANKLIEVQYEGDGSGAVEAQSKTELEGGNDGSAIDAEGVLMNDVDVTYGPAGGAMLVHGFLAKEKLPEEIEADAKEAIGDMIKVIK